MPPLRTALLLALAVIGSISCTSSREKDCRKIVLDYYHRGKFNGQVLVARNDSIICDTALGYSDFTTGRPFRNNTACYIASLAKPVTALAIMLLQQQGMLSYDDTARKYVPELPAYAGNITIRQLLTHTSGLKDYEGMLSSGPSLTNNRVIAWLGEQQGPDFTPGSRFSYSNSGYIVLALVIEQASGMSYARFIQERIFTPLHMNHSRVYDESRPFIEEKALGFDRDKHPDDYAILTTGDGGIYTTAGDLYLLDRALRRNLLPGKENAALMYQQTLLPNGRSSEYGFGWFLKKDAGNHTIALHTGGLNGFRSVFWRNLDQDRTIIALTNQGDAFPLQSFLDRMIDALR